MLILICISRLAGGHLIFDDEASAELVLRAKRILIMSKGSLSIGSEDKPFPNLATIELHGVHTDIELPEYGTKVRQLHLTIKLMLI